MFCRELVISTCNLEKKILPRNLFDLWKDLCGIFQVRFDNIYVSFGEKPETWFKKIVLCH